MEEIEILTWDGSRPVNLVLRRSSEDVKERHLFNAALVNFGALGVIHRIKFKAVKPY